MFDINEGKQLIEYLNGNTKKPVKYFLAIVGCLEIGGFDLLIEVVDRSNLPKRKKATEKFKIINLRNIYNNYLKTKLC